MRRYLFLMLGPRSEVDGISSITPAFQTMDSGKLVPPAELPETRLKMFITVFCKVDSVTNGKVCAPF